MNPARVTFLVHGGSASIEAVRARGIARQLPPECTRFLFREGGRSATFRRWRQHLRQYPPDLVYVLNTALPGVPVALLHRSQAPYILDTGDAVFEMARRSGVGSGWRLPLLWLAETLGQRRAAAIVVRGTRHLEHLRSLGLPRVSLIRDGFAEQTGATDEAVGRLRRELGLEGRFIAGVMGSLVFSPRLRICYGWDLIRALPQLRDLPVTALVIGNGNGEEWLRSEAARLGVADRVVFTGRIPYARVPEYLRLMDVALSTQTNNLPGRVRTTGKLPEYMAAGRFILASRVGEAELLLPQEMLVDYDGEVDEAYPNRLAERIRRLQQNPALLDLRQTLPELAQRNCSYDVLSGQLRDLVAETLRLKAGSRS